MKLNKNANNVNFGNFKKLEFDNELHVIVVRDVVFVTNSLKLRTYVLSLLSTVLRTETTQK